MVFVTQINEKILISTNIKYTHVGVCLANINLSYSIMRVTHTVF